MKKRIVAMFVCGLFLAGCLLFSASAYTSPSTMNLVIVVGAETLAGCRDNRSVFDELLAARSEWKAQPMLVFRADGMEYNDDFIYALIKCQISGVPYGCMADTALARDRYMAFCRQVLKQGNPYVLTGNEELERDGTYLSVHCIGETQTTAGFRALLNKEEPGCMAIELTDGNMYAIQVIVQYIADNAMRPMNVTDWRKMATEGGTAHG